MKLSLLTILLRAGMSLPQIYGLARPKDFAASVRKFPRNYAAGVALMLLATGWFVWNVNAEKESTLALVVQNSSTNVLPVQSSAALSASGQPTNSAMPLAAAAVIPLQPITNAPERKLQVLVAGKNKPISFWGQVVDQDEKPLDGVKIGGNIRTWYVTPAMNFDSRFPTVNAVSDANGKFEIHNAGGDVLTIKSMEKDGYEPEPGAMRGFGFNTSEQFSSDPNSPIVFRMWQTNIHEPLITGDKRFHVVPDGRSYVIDLAKGTIAESGGGDIQVTIKYAQQTIQGQLYDWLSEINIVNGGLLEEANTRSPMFAAPVDGYVPSFQYNQQIKGGQRGSTGQHRFYVSFKNGQKYGRVVIELRAPYNDNIPGLIHIQYAINPSGSRILR